MKSRLLLLIVLAAVLSATAGATTLVRVPLDEIAAVSGEIFVATVLETTTVEGDGPHRLLYTEVVFEDFVWLKGDSAVAPGPYRFAGGRLGDRRVIVVGVPGFTPGERVVLFANRDAQFCDAVGFTQGVFRIVRTAGTGEEIVLDALGRPVVGFAGGFPVTGASGATAMTPGEFTTHVRTLLVDPAEEER